MGKARKRRVPIAASKDSVRSSTPHSSRTLIRRFHVLLKRKAQLEKLPTSDTASSKELANVEDQITELGGLEFYQHMSAVGQGNDRGGGSEKVLIEWLKTIGEHNRTSTKLRLMEVGALKPDNYRPCSSWIKATPIDLHSRHPSILQQDFLLLDNNEHCEKWNIITLSLVLNFVPEARNRGCMLRRAYENLIQGGYLFLALPLPCVVNSRYLDFDHLKALMETIGFCESKCRWKAGGKMAYWLYRKEPPRQLGEVERFQKKVILRQGNRNNFCILL